MTQERIEIIPDMRAVVQMLRRREDVKHLHIQPPTTSRAIVSRPSFRNASITMSGVKVEVQRAGKYQAIIVATLESHAVRDAVMALWYPHVNQ